MNKDTSEISSLVRSRSNSHSGKKEPKSGSGEGNGSVVQDSGFSTETSSSKETHSASSTSGGIVQSAQTMNPNNRVPLTDAEDELWNLLDVIHRKSTRLREEVDYLHSIEKEQSRTNSIPPTFMSQLEKLSKEDVQILRKERDQLLIKISDMEAETKMNRRRADEAEKKLDSMSLAKQQIEIELKKALSHKVELNTKLHDLHKQYITSTSSTKSDTSPSNFQTVPLPTPRSSTSSSSPAFVTTSTSASSASASSSGNQRSNFQPIILKSSPSQSTTTTTTTSTIAAAAASSSQQQGIIDSFNLNDSQSNLGRLDGVVSSPNRCIKVRVADSKKIAAILLETNPIELQRHLLTVTFQNQVSFFTLYFNYNPDTTFIHVWDYFFLFCDLFQLNGFVFEGEISKLLI